MKTDELNKMINNSVNLLFEEVKKGGSERLLDYLDFCSRFYKYSFYNEGEGNESWRVRKI